MANELFEKVLERARCARAGDQCWCRSGVLFESCHEGRDRQSPLTLQAANELVEATMGKHRRACLHFDAPGGCSVSRGRSHSIQRAALERIAEDSHVLGFVPSIPELRNDRHLPQRLGLKVASTTTAFCGKHDDSLFASVENKPFTATAAEVFLLSYRALCWQLFASEWKLLCLLPAMKSMDRGLALEGQVAVQIESGFHQVGAVAESEIFQALKGKLDAKLRMGDVSGLRFTAVEFAETPTLASCSARVPAGDFAGRARDGYRALEDLVPIVFSLIPNVDSGVAIFSWVGESTGNEQFAASLDATMDIEVAEAILRFAFSPTPRTRSCRRRGGGASRARSSTGWLPGCVSGRRQRAFSTTASELRHGEWVAVSAEPHRPA